MNDSIEVFLTGDTFQDIDNDNILDIGTEVTLGNVPAGLTPSIALSAPKQPTAWTAAASEANGWVSVTYGNGKFVAVAPGGTNRVMYSPDGITWTAASASQANQWYSVTYGNGKFVAVSYNGTNRVMYSPDGITWTAASASQANGWISVTYGNGKFVAVSIDGTNRVMYSPDGITWTAAAASQANQWYSVTYGIGKFVAVSYDGTNRVMHSPDGITWTAANASEANGWWSVTYGNGKFVAVSTTGTNQVMRSSGAGTPDTLATLTLSGNATSHANANDVANITFNYIGDAFTASDEPFGPASSNLGVDFIVVDNTIAGTAYATDGVTPLADGTTIRLLVNGASAQTTTVSGGAGAYSFDEITIVNSDVVTVHIDGATEK